MIVIVMVEHSNGLEIVQEPEWHSDSPGVVVSDQVRTMELDDRWWW